LVGPVILKTAPVDPDDQVTPHRLTIEHASLPSQSIVHEARNKDALTRAHRAFSKAFGHLSDTAD
jgi:hypothetical protein